MKKLIPIILFLLLLTTVHAALLRENDMLACWKFDEASGNVTSVVGGFSAASAGTPTFQAPTKAPGSTFSIDYDATGDQHDGLDWGELEGLKNFTIAFWVNSSGTAGHYASKCDGAGCANDPWDFSNTEAAIRTVAGDCGAQVIGPDTGSWTAYIFNRNATGLFVRENLTVISSDTSCNGNMQSNTQTVTFGDAGFGGAEPLSQIDTFCIWNVSLNTTDINTYFTSGITLADATNIVINTTWNVTSNNTFAGENTTAWIIGGTVNITSNLLSLSVTTDLASNMSCDIDVERNYTANVADNVATKAGSTETTSHALTVYKNISLGNHCLYCSFIKSNGLERNSGNSTSGCLNFTRVNDITKVNFTLNPILNELSYNINFSKVTTNFTLAILTGGNWTWNFTDNSTDYVLNNTNNVSLLNFTFNITNNGTGSSSIRLAQNQTKPWYDWYCDGVNITSVAVSLFNLASGSTRFVNCTLSLINISQTFVNYSKTVDRSDWGFTYTFS